jgi:hypothetical protein
MFTLRDPRMDAFSQAGSNLGGGLADSLVDYIQNRRFSNATRQMNPNMSLQQQMQVMAQNNVSQPHQERFFSPAIQNRMANEQAGNLIQNAIQKFQKGGSNQEFVQEMLKAQAVTGNLGNVDKILQMVSRPDVPGTPNSMGQPGQMPPSGTKDTPSGQHTAGAGQTGVTSRGVATTGVGGSEAFETIPATPTIQPYTPDEMNSIRAQMRQRYLDPALADAETERQIGQRQTQYQNQIQELQLAQGSNREQRARQEEIDAAVNSTLENAKQNPMYRPVFGAIASELARKEDGTPKQRAEMVNKKFLRPAIDDLETIAKKLPLTERLQGSSSPKKESFLKSINPTAQRFIDRFGPDHKTEAVEQLRTELRSQAGIGDFTAELAIKYPDETTLKHIRSVGKVPGAFVRGLQRNLLGYNPPKIEGKEDKRQAEAADRLDKVLDQELPAGTSPIVIKELVVNGLGWPDSFFDEAMSRAKKRDVYIPDYNRTAANDAMKSRSNIDYSLIDDLGGTRARGLMEFYK